MTARRLLAATSLGLVVSASLAAQQVFRVGTDVVLLSVTVADADGHMVGGLNQGNFQVFEDGVLQEISVFSRDPQPIALSILLDTSTSMEHKLGVAQQAATGFVRQLGDKDVAQIIDFDSRPLILQTFTHDAALLERAIHQTNAGGSTSLYNALYTALAELKGFRKPADSVRREAIVVLSDGEDTSSIVSYDDVLDLSKRSEVIVYAIGLRSKADAPLRGGFNEADFVLRTLSQETGGHVFFVEDVNQLPAVYGQIADELANQYSIGYISKNPKRDGAWRRVVVRVDHAGATARTKAGYFAPTTR
jgi:Ca-activated chloride channel homolog